MSRTKVLLADDHQMFSQGLQGLLEDEFELVGIVADGQALVEAAQKLDPDVIVVDISMPVLNGLDAVRQLKAKGFEAKIIFLTMHADDRLLAEAFRCGGSGYVLKQSAGEELILAIRQVLAGHKYVTPLIATEWVQDVSQSMDGAKRSTLTSRQREVLQLVIEGCTMKEVATRLGISTRTAESHKYEMMEGLGVDNTAELIQYAIKLGLTSE
ncbi:MAG: response regulator transcription factor [Pyrinomonadaceae bacterium]|nr:response regulator transcription factor [Pyrinomonadaceae bacterium]